MDIRIYTVQPMEEESGESGFADGRICDGFAFGGPDAQRELLLGEGVAFKDDMHVDLAACRWPAGL